MSRSRRPSNAESGTKFRKVIPDSYPDDYRNRGRDRERDFRGDSSFYRRDFAHSRERNRTLYYDRPNRSNSFGECAELGHERPRALSRKSMPDHRPVTRPSQSPDSRRTSGQSSPKFNRGNQPISPRTDLPRSGVATPTVTAASSTLPPKPPTVDSLVEESPTGSKAGLSDETAIKDPRLRRINTKVKQNTETVTAGRRVASPQPYTTAINNPAPAKELTSNSSITRTTSFSVPGPPFTGSNDVRNTLSTPPEKLVRKPSDDATDVNMTDVNQRTCIVASAAQDPATAIQIPQCTPTSSNLTVSFIKLMTDFADQVSTTSILKYKKDIAKQKSSRCKYTDRRNRENFKDYPVTIEQGTQARQIAEQELAGMDQELKDHVQAQNALVRTMAGFFVSQVEQEECARDMHFKQASALQENQDRIEELSINISSTLAEAKQAKLNATKSIKEAYELVERATSTYKEAQQATQKTFTQVNELTTRLNELSTKVSTAHMDAQQTVRTVGTLNRDFSEDHTQLNKVMNLIERLEVDMTSLRTRMTKAEEDIRSLRKRTAETENDVKGLWDGKASLGVLEGMRKDVNEDIANVKKTQKDMVGQVRSLDAGLKQCRQSYETLAPEVEAHSKKIEEIELSPQTPDGNSRNRLCSVETPTSPAVQAERSDLPAKGLQADVEELRRSFQDLSQKFGSSATLSDLVSIRDSIATLQIETQKLNIAEITKQLEVYGSSAETDRDELKELTKEVDELHTGQDQIRDTFTMHNEEITTRVDKTEQDIRGVSEEMKVTFDKAKQEAETIAKQIREISKRIEAPMMVATARPTPPSAPPTPQMHPAANLLGRGSPPVIDNGALSVRLNEVAQDIIQLKGYVSSQFSPSSNLHATLSSLNHAVLSLQSRYNNLTTEPMVRAMVQQMQLMYPYASTAQNEIRDVRAAVNELEKLPPKIELLTSQVDLHTKDIASLDQKLTEQDKERVLRDNKQERLVVHVKEERDNLKQHVQEQYEKLKQHVERQYQKVDRNITATKEESILSVAQVAAKVSRLEEVAGAWATVKRAEKLSQLSDKEGSPKPLTQLKATGLTISRASPRYHRSSSQTRASSPGESDSEALLKTFHASTGSRRVEATSNVSETDDSDAPLALTRTNSSKSVLATSPSGRVTGTSGKRKRAQVVTNDRSERPLVWDIPTSPSRRKVVRRS